MKAKPFSLEVQDPIPASGKKPIYVPKPPLCFFIAIVPFGVSHHSKKIITRGKFASLADTKELVQAKTTYESLLARFRPAQPFELAIELSLRFQFPYLKGHSAKTRLEGIRKISKPDCSNIAKTIEDCLVRMRFMIDDGQVDRLVVEKIYSANPGIMIGIRERF